MDSYYIPLETSIVDEIVTAIGNLLTEKLITDVSEYDVTRAVVIKAGPRQDDPESITVLIHENDPDNPSQWAHSPKSFRTPRPSGGLTSNRYTDMEQIRVSSGRVKMGGGSLYTRAFTLEIEVFGMYVVGVDIDRETTRRIAAIVENRATQALLEAGRRIGTGTLIRDSFNEYVVDGPFLGDSWTDPEQGESLIVRKYIQFWYMTSKDWSMNE